MNPVQKIGIDTGSSLTCEDKTYSINMRPPTWFIIIFDVAFNNSALLYDTSFHIICSKAFHFSFKKKLACSVVMESIQYKSDLNRP